MLRRTLLAAPALIPLAARAQAPWPARPVSIVVPFTPGGSTDIATRILAERLGPKLGPEVRIIVENRAGAGGSLGADLVRRAAPDGHMLLMATASSHGSNPAALPASTPYNPVEDFTAVAMVGGGPLVIVVPGRSPHRTIQELWTAMRARPGALRARPPSGAGSGR